jgi:hypothetical protein
MQKFLNRFQSQIKKSERAYPVKEEDNDAMQLEEFRS